MPQTKTTIQYYTSLYDFNAKIDTTGLKVDTKGKGGHITHTITDKEGKTVKVYTYQMLVNNQLYYADTKQKIDDINVCKTFYKSNNNDDFETKQYVEINGKPREVITYRQKQKLEKNNNSSSTKKRKSPDNLTPPSLQMLVTATTDDRNNLFPLFKIQKKSPRGSNIEMIVNAFLNLKESISSASRDNLSTAVKISIPSHLAKQLKKNKLQQTLIGIEDCKEDTCTVNVKNYLLWLEKINPKAQEVPAQIHFNSQTHN